MARTFVHALAIALAVPPEIAADLRLAVSELATAIVQSRPTQPLTITAQELGEYVLFHISPWVETELGDGTDPWSIVTSLFDDVIVQEDMVILSARIIEPG